MCAENTFPPFLPTCSIDKHLSSIVCPNINYPKNVHFIGRIFIQRFTYSGHCEFRVSFDCMVKKCTDSIHIWKSFRTNKTKNERYGRYLGTSNLFIWPHQFSSHLGPARSPMLGPFSDGLLCGRSSLSHGFHCMCLLDCDVLCVFSTTFFIGPIFA